MPAEEIAYRYTGKDPLEAHHSGIPARDLSDADVRALDAERRDVLKKSALYRAADAKAKDAPKPPKVSQEPTKPPPDVADRAATDGEKAAGRP